MADAGKGDGRLVFDCLSAVLLLAVAILGAYMPKYLASRGSLQQGTASSLAFHLGNMLSGGVMLSAGFCHLLADALRQLAFLGRFPIAPFLAACGYLITLLADQVVQLLTTDAEDQHGSQLTSPQPGFGSPAYPASAGFSSRQGHRGPGFSSRPASARPQQAAAAGGSAFGSFFRNGLGHKPWAYSRLEEVPQHQQQQQHLQDGSSGCQDGATIELIAANGVSSSSTSSHPDPGAQALLQQQQHHACCHDPSDCACSCSAGCDAGACGAATAISPRGHLCQAAGLNSSSTGLIQGSSAGQLQGSAAHSRRPGSAGGLARAGLGLGSVARTRSLTSPGAGPALSPLQAAAAAEFAGQQGVPGGFAPFEAAAAAAGGGSGVVGSGLPTVGGSISAAADADSAAADALSSQQQQPHHVLPPVLTAAAAAAAGGSAGGSDDALCVLAAGSPRSVSAAGLHPRSPRVKAAAGATAAGLIHQQQQHAANGHHLQHADQQQQLPLPLPLQQQQQQLEPQRTSSSISQRLLQPVRQLSIPQAPGGSCCCCGAGGGGGVCRSAPPSAQPDMTEACTVARVAGHLELEVMSTATGGHNHAHFQVFLSQRPLSFATSLLLACALCIHSILEGLALGAQQSMQATEDIMLAIAAHKGLAAYALGASIVESGASDSKFWVVVCLFAAATPLGIAIGYASSVLGHGPVSAAMSALASGTFLYVALNEVIPKELEHPDGHRLAKVAALLLGFGLMSLLAVWA